MQKRIDIDLYDRHFSERNNAELILFRICTVLRRNKEIVRIKESDLWEKKGCCSICVKGKGGHIRNEPIVGAAEKIRQVIERIQNSEDGLVLPAVSICAGVNHYRAIYARRIYDAIARDPHTIPRLERYCGLGEGKAYGLTGRL